MENDCQVTLKIFYQDLFAQIYCMVGETEGCYVYRFSIMYDHRLFFQCMLVLLNVFSQCRLVVSDISIDDDKLMTILQKTSLPT